MKAKTRIVIIIISAVILIAVLSWVVARCLASVECTVFTGGSSDMYTEPDKVFKAISLSYLVYGCECCENISGTVNEILDTEKMGIIIENADISRTDKSDPTTAMIDSASFIRKETGNFRFLKDLKNEKNSFYGAAFADDENKTVWISYSGSVSFTDAMQSVLLFAGASLSGQEKCAFELYESVLDTEEIKSGYSLIITGHSLGGALASMVSYMSDAQAVTISGADGIAIRKINDIVKNKKDEYRITNYLTEAKGHSLKDLIQKMMFWGDYDGIVCHTYENNGMVDNTHCPFGFIRFEGKDLSKPFLPKEIKA